MSNDDLSDFERTEFTHDGSTRTVYRRGSGPAVIVIAELPGITPKVLDFANQPLARSSLIVPRGFDCDVKPV